MPPPAFPSSRADGPTGASSEIEVIDEDEEAVEDILMPDPISTEGISRCSECVWEVVDGICQGPECGLEHNVYDEEELEHTEVDPSTSTYDDMLHPDRQVLPRGDTPLREVDHAAIAPPPVSYIGRKAMYYALLSRGATREMCVRYDLQYHPESGIFAWADEDLLDDFTGELIEKGDRWQICLGRRVKLDPGDKDGSVFMTELVEEATMFQHTTVHEHGRWETVLTHQGQRRRRRVWVTRPIIGAYNTFDGWLSDSEDSDDYNDTNDELSEDGLNIDPRALPASVFVDVYEDESEPEDEGMDVDPSYSDGEIYEHHAPEVVLEDCAWDSSEEVDGADEDMEVIDSDEPGSDWDSDEIMSGDEIVPYVARLKREREALGSDEGSEDEEEEDDDSGEGGNAGITQPPSGNGEGAEEGGTDGHILPHPQHGHDGSEGNSKGAGAGAASEGASGSGITRDGSQNGIPIAALNEHEGIQGVEGNKTNNLDVEAGGNIPLPASGHAAQTPTAGPAVQHAHHNLLSLLLNGRPNTAGASAPQVAANPTVQSAQVAVPAPKAKEFRPNLDISYWNEWAARPSRYHYPCSISPTVAGLETELRWHDKLRYSPSHPLISTGNKDDKIKRVRDCVRAFWEKRAVLIRDGKLEEFCSEKPFLRWPKWILDLEQPTSLEP